MRLFPGATGEPFIRKTLRSASLFHLIAFSLLFISLVLPGQAKAEWVNAVFSERAKIDSIERAQVLYDWEVQRPYAWGIIPLGDINQDSFTDVLVTVNLNTNAVNPAYLYYGGKTVDTVFSADQAFEGFRPLVNKIGDVNGDGFVDLLQFDINPYRMDFFWGGPELDDIADYTIPNHSSRANHRISDLDGNGAIDLALSVSVNGGDVHIFRMDEQRDTIPEYVISDTAVSFGRNLAILDINGDNYDDLAVACYFNRDTQVVRVVWTVWRLD